MVLGFGRVGGGGGRFLEPVFLPGTATPSVLQGRCSAVSDFIGRCEVSSWKFPPKFQIKHLGNLERIHRQNLSNSSTKQMCAESGFCALQVGKIHFARQVLVAEGYYPTLNNKWWDGYQSQKVVIMEDVDKEVLGFGRGGREAVFFRTSLPPWNSSPFSITGALFRSERFYWSLRG